MKKLLIFAGLAASAFAADDAPSWLREYSTAKTPSYESRVPAVVLLDEEAVTVEEGGRVITTNRRAIKILNKEGRREAVERKIYATSAGKVRDMHAWLIRPSGEVKKYGKNEVMDVALSPDYLYDESRARVVNASSDADPGAVFGSEVVSEDRSIFTQFDFRFQGDLPVLLSRFSLTVPAGWRAEGVVFNGKSAVQQSGSTYTWEARDLPFIETEPASPPIYALAPRVAVSYFPADGAKSTQGKFFSGWPDVSRWLASLQDPRAVADEELTAKARSLTAAAPNEWERIRAIATYVQAMHYVAIEIGLGRGGGYQPHPATDVFHKQYGDCKDKANLMRTMLTAVGITSYPVSLFALDAGYVREEWPSPQQFNHAIIAVKLTDPAIKTAAAIDHPKLGRLLFFDPTAETVTPGDLPRNEQGSLVLIDAEEGGGLVRMPVLPVSANRVERETQVVLLPDGSITAAMNEHAYGQSAASFRSRLRNHGSADFNKSIEQWISATATGAALGKVAPADAPNDGRFDLQVEFQAARYAQVMQGRLLIFKPAVMSRRNSAIFSAAKRQNPVVLHGEAFTETVKVKLPAGFKVDEMPRGGKLETAFGAFSCAYESSGGEFAFTRKLEIHAATVPVEQYGEMKRFFEQVAGAEQQPVVLVKE